MPLRAYYAKKDEIPEGAEDFYVEKDGGFLLAVESANGFELVNPSGLKSALVKERNRADTAETALKAYDGLDADVARSAIEKLEGMSDELDDEATKKYEALQSQLKEKYEGEKKKLIEKYETEKKTLGEELTSVSSQLEDELLVSNGKSAIAKHGGSIDLLLPVVKSRSRIAKRDDGKRTIEIPDTDGNARLSTKPNSMEPMDLDELVLELRDDPRYERAFDPIDASGSNATPNEGRPRNSYTIKAEDARDPVKYRAMREQAEKAGRQVSIVD